MRRLLLALLVVLCAARNAAAGDDPEQKQRDARVHYERAMARYGTGDYGAAIHEFMEAYELAPSPRLLFNIAQACRLNRDFTQAVFYYTAYLRADANPANRGEVERRIDEMGGLLREQSRAVPPPHPGPSEPRWPRRNKLELAAGLATAGVGLGLLGAAIYFNVEAGAASDELSRLSSSGGAWSARTREVYDRGETDQIAAGVLYGVAGAAVVTGVVLTALGARRPPFQLAVVRVDGGGSLTAGGRW